MQKLNMFKQPVCISINVWKNAINISCNICVHLQESQPGRKISEIQSGGLEMAGF